MTPAEMLAEFHAALGDEPGRGNAELRMTLHREEHKELMLELGDESEMLGVATLSPKADEDIDRAQLARELADVVYLAYGTAHAFDIDLEVALAKIHRAAMSKVDPTCVECRGSGRGPINATNDGSCPRCNGSGKGQRVEREDGKIMKPPGFIPPDMSAAVGHRRAA